MPRMEPMPIPSQPTGKQTAATKILELQQLEANLKAQPRDVQALLYAAGLSIEVKQFLKGMEFARRLIRLQPTLPIAHFFLGCAQANLNEWKGALVSFAKARALDPQNGASLVRLVQAQARNGHPREALALADQALDHPALTSESLLLLADTLKGLGATAAAQVAVGRCLDLGATAAVHNAQGQLFLDGQDYTAALEHFSRAAELDPQDPSAVANLGWTYLLMGDEARGLPLVEAALELDPCDHQAVSRAIFHLNANPSLSLEEAHRKTEGWMDRAYPLHAPAYGAGMDRNPDRKLRIGYVSADFRSHVMVHWIAPLLADRDRDQFEVICFAGNALEDEWTSRFKAQADRWVRAVDMSTEDLARRIATLKVDILVDLMGHTVGNRLDVFALKPAPVQVSMLGFDRTTGLRAMDWRITHTLSDPSGEADRWSTERLWRLQGRFAYWPCERAPEVGPLPAARNGYLTFGFLGNHARVGQTFLEAAARLLLDVPNARLALLCLGGNDAAHQAFKREFFQQRGVDQERIVFLPRTSPEATFLKYYQAVDITLNSFPAEGGTTICESLWMGVPVLVYDRPGALRHTGMSILHDLGMPEWVASDLDSWIGIAKTWSHHLEALAELRLGLRPRMAASSLCDSNAAMKAIEAAYRGMWQDWCSRT